MDDVLAEALAPVLRDLDRSGLTPPTFESVDWDDGDPEYATAMTADRAVWVCPSDQSEVGPIGG